MNKNRAAKISNIIEMRCPFAEKIAQQESNLRVLNSKLDYLEEKRQQLITQIDDSSVCEHLKEISFEKFIPTIESELEPLEKLKARFCRDTLKIAIAGRARQGKSELLKSLTGLTDAEIPAGKRGDCTGARSTIYHKPNIQTYADVWFHSERSFLNDVITPYYEKLSLGVQPRNIDVFANKQLPALPSELYTSAKYKAMYEHLRTYHANIEKYRHLLREPSPRRISRDEIREYVAQYNVHGDPIYNYLAVQEVEIFCSFPNTDIGQIALVDTPGLGDTGVGNKERLQKILGQDVDAIVFVRMPNSIEAWRDYDVELYDDARTALVDLPISLWSFMALNRTDKSSDNGDNLEACQRFAKNIAIKHINVVDCITANCANQEDANNVLDRVLDYLATNITTLDKQYADTSKQRLNNIQSQLKTEINKTKNVFGNVLNGGEESCFDDLFDEFWNNITTALAQLLTTLKEQRDSQDEVLKNQVQQVLQRCREDTGIPTIEEINVKRNGLGAYTAAYSFYLHKIRTHLSRHFLSLDDALKHSIEQAKNSVADVLVTQGKLGGLIDARGYEFIKKVYELIPDNLGNLKLAFQVFSDFNLSYRGLIQHRIRKHFDTITPDTAARLPQNPTAQNVLENLQELQPETVFKCEEALQDFLSEPSQAAFAMVEEFIDQVLRAERIEREWRTLLREVRANVWVEFNDFAERNRVRQEWLNLVEQVVAINESLNLNF